ncbi:sarcoplasmic calcium-binding proteins I, III, and IV [Trichonephila clavata]|uniref:Sarcoplasmic calcium-binding proteins I, III, and IV n=1 Tax=Trichonephila clavata TaxID=2740835 RepID=A0A8X6G2T8_TRICU|nr:sarcoplasmic calcium-binding proteins I, III, and IV [Trichonephila clavata]
MEKIQKYVALPYESNILMQQDGQKSKQKRTYIVLHFFQDEDRANGNAMTSDRFRELVYDFWVSQNPDSPGKYVCGTFDSDLLQELEDMNKSRK